MELITFLILLILGLLAGILAGLFGIGGGILFTPVLFVVFNNAGVSNPVVLTVGTSLFCIFIASSASSVRQYRQDNFYWQEGLNVGLLGVIGVTLGKLVITSSWYNRQVFVIFFSTLLLFVAFMFFKRGRAGRNESKDEKKPVNLPQATVTGGLGGFVAALAGIGGGGVMVPLMNLHYNKSFHRAASISSLAIVIISLAGWLQLTFTSSMNTAFTQYALGFVDFGAALPLAFGGLTGGVIGVHFNHKMHRRCLQYAFGLLAVAMAVKLLFEVF